MQLISLIAENFKRIKVARIAPNGPLTKIIGKNGQGKTSAIDAVAAALGGKDHCPDQPIRNGQDSAQVIVDLGDIKVKRRWTEKGSTLEVFSAEGAKFPSPQAMLDKLMGDLSFDPLQFNRMKPVDQAATLAKIAGLDLATISGQRRAKFDERTNVNRDLKAAQAQLAAMPVVEAPAEEVSLAELLKEIEDAENHNKAVEDLQRVAKEADVKASEVGEKYKAAVLKPAELEAQYAAMIKKLEDQIAVLKAERDVAIEAAIKTAELIKKQGQELCAVADEAESKAGAATYIDPAPLREKARNAESVNATVRANKTRAAKAAEVESKEAESKRLTESIEAIDTQRDTAITAAKLPVDNLSLGESGVLLNGLPFEQASGAEQLRVSVAIGLALNPKLKLMLIRDGSLLDDDSMQLLATMAEQAGAQILIERVDQGNEVGVKIVDGECENEPAEPVAESKKTNGRKPVAV